MAKGSRGGKRRGGAANSGAEAPTMKHVGKAEVDNWMEGARAGEFLGSAPDTIEVGGVTFKWFTDSKSVDSKGNIYYNNSYQSTQQASNGEWPVLEVVVRERRYRGTIRHEFDTSPATGTGLR